MSTNLDRETGQPSAARVDGQKRASDEAQNKENQTVQVMHWSGRRRQEATPKTEGERRARRTAAALVVGVLAAAPATAQGAYDPWVQVMPDDPVVVAPAGGMRPGAVLVGRYTGRVNDPGEPFAVEGMWSRCRPRSGSCSALFIEDPGLGTVPAAYDNLTPPFESTYVVQPEDIGYSIRYTVYAHGENVSQIRNSDEVWADGVAPRWQGSLQVRGTPRDGEAQTATTSGGMLGTPPFTTQYMWERCDAAGASCVPIEPVVTTRRTATAADVGHTLRTSATITNAFGTHTVMSAPTPVIEAIPTENLTQPSVSGMRVEGQQLTADLGTWRGSAPVTLRPVWERCDADGSACVATTDEGASIALEPEDVGRTFRVSVTASGPGGNVMRASAPTDPIDGREPVNVQVPRVDAAAGDSVEPAPPGSAVALATRPGRTLSVSSDRWDGTASLEIAVQWERCDATVADCAAIAGATRRSYSPAPADVGSAVRARVTATNVAGQAEVVTDPVLVLAGEMPASGTDERPAGEVVEAAPAAFAPRSPRAKAAAILSLSRPTTRCVPQLRERLGGTGALSVRGTLPGHATIAAGGRPVLTLTGGRGSISLRTADGRLLGTARDVGTVAFSKRTSSRIAARSTGGKVLIALGRQNAWLVVKGRICTQTRATGARIAARADQSTRASVFLVADTGAPLTNAAIDVTDGDRRTTIRTNAEGVAELPLTTRRGSRDITLAYAGDDGHLSTRLAVEVAVKSTTTIRGHIDRSTAVLRGRVAGAAGASVTLQYLNAERRWRTLGRTVSGPDGTWTVRRPTPARHAGSTQLVLRAVVNAHDTFGERVGGQVRVDVAKRGSR